MALNSLPNELLLLIASYLDDIDDKSALARTCRRTYEATRCDIFRLLAVDEHANAAIRAAITGHTAILDALWPYNPRLVNRYWEYDPEPYEGNLRERDLRDWDQSGYPCPVCQLLHCQHPPYPDNKSVAQGSMTPALRDLELFRATACFDYPRTGRYTLLHLAALYDDVDQITWLLDHGASIHAPCALITCREFEEDGEYPILTALQLALGSRSEKSAKLLIERGASLNTSAIPRNRSQERRHQLDCWTPPLCVAAAYGLSDTVRLVLRKGIPVDERDDWGYTALHHAADSCWEEEYLGVLKVLLDAGADLNDRANATHRNPLEIAFRQGNFAVVNHLLDLGATLDQLNDEDGRGATGLGLLQFTCAFEARGRALRSCVHSCFSNSRLDTETFTKEKWERARQALVLKLLDLGYDPNSKASLDHPWCRDDIDGYAPPRGQLDQAWWETRARSNILPRTNVTALNAVSFDSGADLMNLLIRRGAEVDAQDSNGLTVLWLQCLNEAILDDLYPYWEDTFTYPGPGYQWREKMKLLLRAGARIDPWVDTAAKYPSSRALELSLKIDTDSFNFMIRKASTRNISDASLGYLAGLLLTSHQYRKALIILKHHRDVRLALSHDEVKIWMEESVSRPGEDVVAHNLEHIIALLQYPLPEDLARHLQRLLEMKMPENSAWSVRCTAMQPSLPGASRSGCDGSK